MDTSTAPPKKVGTDFIIRRLVLYMGLNNSSLSDLFHHAVAGKSEFWDAFCQRIQSDLERVARRLCDHEHHAQDAVQEAFMAVHSGAQRIRKQGEWTDSRLLSYCKAIVAHKAITATSRARRRQHQPVEIADARSSQAPGPEDHMVINEELGLVRQSLSELKEPFAEAITLHHLGGLEHTEVAKIQGVSPTTARTRIWRGLRMLRGALKKKGLPVTSLILLSLFRELRAEVGLSAPVTSITTLCSTGVFFMTISTSIIAIGTAVTLVLTGAVNGQAQENPSAATPKEEVVNTPGVMAPSKADVSPSKAEEEASSSEEPANTAVTSWYRASAEFGGDTIKGYVRMANTEGPVTDGQETTIRQFTMALQLGDRLLEHRYRVQHLNDEHMTPVDIHIGIGSDNKKGGEHQTGRITFDGKEAILSKLGQELRREPYASPVLTTPDGLIAMAASMPFDETSQLTFTSLELEDGLMLKAPHQLRYIGKQDITIDDKEHSLHTFEHTGARIGDASQMWFNDERVMVRALIAGKFEMVLTDQEGALGQINLQN